MGMSATTLRYLMSVKKLTDLEYKSQQICNEKSLLATQSAEIYNQLLTMNVPTPPVTTDYQKMVYTFPNANGSTAYIQNFTKNPEGSEYSHQIIYKEPETERVLMQTSVNNARLKYDSESGGLTISVDGKKYNLTESTVDVAQEDQELVDSWNQAKTNWTDAKSVTSEISNKLSSVTNALDALNNTTSSIDTSTMSFEELQNFLGEFAQDNQIANTMQQKVNVANSYSRYKAELEDSSNLGFTNEDLIAILNELDPNEENTLIQQKLSTISEKDENDSFTTNVTAGDFNLSEFMTGIDTSSLEDYSKFATANLTLNAISNEEAFNENVDGISSEEIMSLLETSQELFPENSNISDLISKLSDDSQYQNQKLTSPSVLNSYKDLIESSVNNDILQLLQSDENFATYNNLMNYDGSQTFETDDFVSLFSFIQTQLNEQKETAVVEEANAKAIFEELDAQLEASGYGNIVPESVKDSAEKDEKIFQYTNENGETEYFFINQKYLEQGEDLDEVLTSVKAMQNVTSTVPNSYVYVTKNANIEIGSNGQIKAITFEDGTVMYPEIQTEEDKDAYNMAFVQYQFETSQYTKTMADLNAKIEIIQSQESQLELQLKQIDTEHKAVQTEMDSLKQVIDKNIELTFKTFG